MFRLKKKRFQLLFLEEEILVTDKGDDLEIDQVGALVVEDQTVEVLALVAHAQAVHDRAQEGRLKIKMATVVVKRDDARHEVITEASSVQTRK